MKTVSGFKPCGYALFFFIYVLQVFPVLAQYEYKGDVSLEREYAEHDFLAACRTGNIEVVQYFLSLEGFNPDGMLISEVSKKPCSGLILAAQDGHSAAVQTLVNDSRIEINQTLNNGRTALMYAAQNGHSDVVQILVGNPRIEINQALNDGWTALILAAQNGHSNVVQILVGDPRIEINQTLNNGWTALHLAAQKGHQDVVTILVEAGAGFNLATNDGVTAFFIAVENGHQEVVKILVEAGADLNLATNDGATALFMAAQEGHHRVVKILVDNGANPFLKWKRKFTSETPQKKAKLLRPIKLGNLCSNPDKWQKYTNTIEILKIAEKKWKKAHPPERKPFFFWGKKNGYPVSAVDEPHPTEQTPLLPPSAAFSRLSLNKRQ